MPVPYIQFSNNNRHWKAETPYHKSIANCEQLVPIVDRLYVYDNSIDNVFPQLLFRTTDGTLMKQYAPIRDWTSMIFEAVAASEPQS